MGKRKRIFTLHLKLLIWYGFYTKGSIMTKLLRKLPKIVMGKFLGFLLDLIVMITQ